MAWHRLATRLHKSVPGLRAELSTTDFIEALGFMELDYEAQEIANDYHATGDEVIDCNPEQFAGALAYGKHLLGQ